MDPFEQLELSDRIDALSVRVSALESQQLSLERSDRKQWRRLRAQRKYTLIFIGLALIGAGLWISEEQLSTADRDMLERVAIAVLTAGAAGAIGVQLEHFDPEAGRNDYC